MQFDTKTSHGLRKDQLGSHSCVFASKCHGVGRSCIQFSHTTILHNLPLDCVCSVTFLEYCSHVDKVTEPSSVFVVLHAVQRIYQLVVNMHQACETGGEKGGQKDT